MDWETEPSHVCADCLASFAFALIVAAICFFAVDQLAIGPFGLPSNVIAAVLGAMLGLLSIPAFRSVAAAIKPGPLSASSGAVIGRKEMIEAASAIVIFFAIAGAVVGVLMPGVLTGLILPAALIAWYALSKIIEHNERGKK